MMISHKLIFSLFDRLLRKRIRHHYMKDVNIFIADPGDQNAIVAVSALARAMKEMHKVAILRCVWRQGQGNVVVGVLTPNVSENDHIVCFNIELFIYSSLVFFPFACVRLHLTCAYFFMCSLIHFISIYFLLLRMFGNFNSPLSAIFQPHYCQMKSNRRLQITS